MLRGCVPFADDELIAWICYTARAKRLLFVSTCLYIKELIGHVNTYHGD
jgi:hypothetical protein